MSGHGEVKPTVVVCCWIWVVLMALLIVTYLVGEYVNAGAGNFAIAFAIAMTKATIIMLFFMHVYYTTPLIRLVAGSGFFFLAILIGLTLCDFKSRDFFEPDQDVAAEVAPIADAPARTAENPEGKPESPAGHHAP